MTVANKTVSPTRTHTPQTRTTTREQEQEPLQAARAVSDEPSMCILPFRGKDNRFELSVRSSPVEGSSARLSNTRYSCHSPLSPRVIVQLRHMGPSTPRLFDAIMEQRQLVLVAALVDAGSPSRLEHVNLLLGGQRVANGTGICIGHEYCSLFLFPDLSVARSGRFRLVFQLYDLGRLDHQLAVVDSMERTVIATTETAEFDVFETVEQMSDRRFVVPRDHRLLEAHGVKIGYDISDGYSSRGMDTPPSSDGEDAW